MLNARLFGPLALELNGEAIPEIAGLRPRSVLAWLLLNPGPHSRAHVAARFWPEVLDTSARASLRTTLSAIRAALETVGAVEYLEADRASVGITAHLPREIDVEAFERLAAADDPGSLEQAFELARAPLLSDLADDWVLEARDEYRDRLVDVALRLADDSERGDDLARAIAWTRQALIYARVRESVHRALMRRLAAAGERAEALDAYARLSAILAAEFGTPPSAETRTLATELSAPGAAAADPVELPPATAAPAVSSGLGRSSVVGRDHELAVLDRAWRGAREGSGGVLLLTGPPGIGKSRLAAELAARVDREGGRGAEGAGLELEGAAPLAPWSDALHELIADAPAPPPEATWPDDLARICRSVESAWGRRAQPPSLDPELERTRLFEATWAAVAWCATDRPLLLVLEDVHLMDAASVALLAAVARRLSTVPALVVVTGRSGEDQVVLAADALRRGRALVDELPLEPLGPDDIAAIVDEVAPGLAASARSEAVAAAGGTPLLAQEAARAAVAGVDPSQGLGAWVRGPLTRLDGPARRLVDIVAAAGRPLERGEAAQLVGAERIPDALEEACRAHLLDAQDNRRIGFIHALVRDACYRELAPARRAWLHGDLADALLTRPSRSVPEVARHLLLARRDEEASSYLAAAASEARQLGAFDEAAAFLREATAAAGSDELEAELWLLLADTESWRGHREAYEEAFRRALGLIERVGDPGSIASAHVAHARCLRTTLCFPDDALAAYERALDVIDQHDVEAPELQVLALAGAAWGEAMSGDVERAHELIAAAESLAETDEDPALASELALDRAAALMRAGRFDESEEPCRRAAELARKAGSEELGHVARITAASAAAARGDPARALELAEQAAALEAVGTGPRTECVVTRAYALSRLGRDAEARHAAEELEALAARSGDPAEELVCAFDQGSIALAAGDLGEAAELFERALAEDLGRVPRSLARLRLAEARLRGGEPEAGAAELGRVPFEPVGPADMPDTLVVHLRRLQGLLASLEGDEDLALRRLDQAEGTLRNLLEGGPSGDAFAAVFVDLARPPVAGLLEPGIELGRVLADRALVLARSDRAQEAREALRQAEALAAQLHFDGYRGTISRAETMIGTEA